MNDSASVFSTREAAGLELRPDSRGESRHCLAKTTAAVLTVAAQMNACVLPPPNLAAAYSVSVRRKKTLRAKLCRVQSCSREDRNGSARHLAESVDNDSDMLVSLEQALTAHCPSS